MHHARKLARDKPFQIQYINNVINSQRRRRHERSAADDVINANHWVYVLTAGR